MCIATVYVDDSGKIEKVMQDVVSVKLKDEGILITTILGEEKLLDGRIRNIDFLKHLVTVESG